MKNIGSVAVVSGFLLWFGGELINYGPLQHLGHPHIGHRGCVVFCWPQQGESGLKQAGPFP